MDWEIFKIVCHLITPLSLVLVYCFYQFLNEQTCNKKLLFWTTLPLAVSLIPDCGMVVAGLILMGLGFLVFLLTASVLYDVVKGR